MKLYDNDSYRDEFMNGVYALLSSEPTSDLANQIIDLFDLAPAVEATAEPSNDPLTLDELREMDGEPVWVEHYKGGEWVTVYWDYVDRIATAHHSCLFKDEYGEEWLAYRRKPEET